MKRSLNLPMWLCVVSILFVVLTCARATHKPFWCDEIATLAIAGQPNLADLWVAETAGFDHQPPLSYILTKVSIPFGKEELTARLPAIAGYLAMIVCLSLFVARRLPAPFPYMAVALPILSAAYGYAYEARPYGLLVGSAGCVILCWQTAADEATRPWIRRASLAFLTATLWIALLTHMFAILLYLPLGAAELWRSVQRRRVDLGILASLFLGAAPIVIYRPLMEGTSGFAMVGPIFAPTIRRLLAMYWLHVSGALAPIAILLIVLGAVAFLRHDDLPSAWAALRSRVPAHELVLLAGFAVSPVALFVLSVSIHGPLIPRYTLPAMLGFAGLFAYLVFLLARTRPRLVRGAALAVLVWFVADFAWTARTWSNEIPYRNSPFASAAAEVMAKTDRPVVVANVLSFLPLEHYLDRRMGERLVFLYDPSLALRHTGGDGGGTWPSLGRPWLKLPGKILPYREFLASNKRFFLYDCGDRRIEWNLPQLTAEGAVIQPMSLPGLYDVRLGD